MHRNTKKQIFSAILKRSRVDTYVLLDEFRRDYYTDGFDNTVMRFVRRLASSGYLKRTARGSYKLTARGRKYMSKNV